MSKFNLESDFAPTGDQPAAIEKLTQGLRDGLRDQTLLGVTGSGKSVVGSSKVFVKRNDAFLYLPIAQLGNVFSKYLPDNQEATQVATLKLPLQTVAFTPDNGRTSLKRVAEISRHRYTGELYTVKTACGRVNQFTDSHNVFALRDCTLQLLKSSSLRVGDWLPVPDVLPAAGSKGVDYLDMREWLPEDAFYVAVERPETIPVGTVTKRKLWGVTNVGERIRIADYHLLARSADEARMDRVGSNKLRATIPVIVPAKRALWRFIGLYIAEGHSTGKYLTLSTGDISIAQEFSLGAAQFGLSVSKRQKLYDYQVSGRTIAGLMQSWCGHSAKSKCLPPFWPQCSNQQLGELLSGVFAGDGWAESNSVCLVSSSSELVYDIQCALLRFGVHARVRYRAVKYNNMERDSWVLSIYGRGDLYKFQTNVGFGLRRKDQRLAQNLAKAQNANTNVDVFPLPAAYIQELCKRYGFFQRDIARVANVSRSLVSMYFSSKRVPARRRSRAILEFLLEKARTADAREVKRLEQLISLTNLFWTPVGRVGVTPTEGEVVYDFTVPQAETFLAGCGGYFVHNTFTMANVIQNLQKPTLVLSHNKTLAAQLYGEFKKFFPDNAVHYFVSYFDYYQPEAYIPRSDTYIEKDSAINEEIDRLRHAATDSLLSRKDVIIVASVSCIYGIGSVEDYDGLSINIKVGERRVRDKFLRHLTDIQYQRNDIDFHRSTFRVRGDVVDVFPAGEEVAYRIEFFGDDIERITKLDPLTGEILAKLDSVKIFPGSHYVTPFDKLKIAMGKIEQELEQRLAQFKREGKLLEAQRLGQRTRFDLEMLQETGFVKGIENYSRYLTNREPGEQPATLLDYFPDDFMMFIDESHMTIPQVRGMYNGDRARKEVLVEHGFRLPSALDNRPLTFTEFEKHVNKVIYVSATPAQYELSRSPEPAQQVIRPTGLLDPPIEVRPIEGQIDDLIAEIRATIDKRQRVLVTTLTKRMSEELTEYLQEVNLKVAYLHSDIDTLDRTDILRDLRLGTYDVLVGINLLREGLDLPEVSLVAILDADKEGFLRSEQALIQTVGRAARHVEGHVIMYADHVTESMRKTMSETTRRRKIQEIYNKEHGITATGISKSIEKGLRPDLPEEAKRAKLDLKKIPSDEYPRIIEDLTSQMDLAAANLEFEKAAELRDIIADIKKKMGAKR